MRMRYDDFLTLWSMFKGTIDMAQNSFKKY